MRSLSLLRHQLWLGDSAFMREEKGGGGGGGEGGGGEYGAASGAWEGVASGSRGTKADDRISHSLIGEQNARST